MGSLLFCLHDISKAITFVFFHVIAVLQVTFYISHQEADVEEYRLRIQESGTEFNETVTIDENEQTELFRVPTHNDVEKSDIMFDFKKVRFKNTSSFPCTKTQETEAHSLQLMETDFNSEAPAA